MLEYHAFPHPVLSMQVTGIAADNAAVMNKTAEKLGTKHFKCLAHSLHLAFKAFVAPFEYFKAVTVGLCSVMKAGGTAKRYEEACSVWGIKPSLFCAYQNRWLSTVEMAQKLLAKLDNAAPAAAATASSASAPSPPATVLECIRRGVNSSNLWRPTSNVSTVQVAFGDDDDEYELDTIGEIPNDDVAQANVKKALNSVHGLFELGLVCTITEPLNAALRIACGDDTPSQHTKIAEMVHGVDEKMRCLAGDDTHITLAVQSAVVRIGKYDEWSADGKVGKLEAYYRPLLKAAAAAARASLEKHAVVSSSCVTLSACATQMPMSHVCRQR